MELANGHSRTGQDLSRRERQARISAPAQCQPPRPDHRRDRHRQDGLAAGDGRGLLRRRRAGLLRRRQRRPRRPRHARRAEGLPRQAAPSRSASPPIPASQAFPGRLLGPLRQGGPSRSARPISEIGPLLLARLLDLNDTQEGVLNIAFRSPTRRGSCSSTSRTCGRCSPTSPSVPANSPRATATCRRRRSARSSARCSCSSSRAATTSSASRRSTSADLMRTTTDGRGIVNILAAVQLMQSPRLYATFLLWLLSELFEDLPEVGDPDKPKLVFFFDEAHLLFNDAPKALLEKIEQVVRLIRSKGRRRLFRHAEPARRARDRAGPDGQPRPARAPRLHAARHQGGQGGGRHLPAEPGFSALRRDHRARRRRGPRLDARGQGRAVDRPAHADAPAVLAHRRDHGRGARRGHRGEPDRRRSTTRPSTAKSAFEVLQSRDRDEDDRGRRPSRPAPGGAARPPGGQSPAEAAAARRHPRLDLRHQPAARPAPDDRPARRPRRHAHGHQPGRRRHRRRFGRQSAARSAARSAAPSSAACSAACSAADQWALASNRPRSAHTTENLRSSGHKHTSPTPCRAIRA